MDRQKKLLQLLGLIVILISVLIYYGYNHMNKKCDNTTDNNVSVTETVVPTATNIAEEDSNGNKNNTVKQSTDKPAISFLPYWCQKPVCIYTTNNTSSNNDNTNSAKADEYYDDLNNSDGVHTVPEGEDETETVDGIEVIKNPKEGVQ